jgi:homocysteine S-methyltransferase
MTFAELIESRRLALTEGAVIERLRRDASVRLDPHVLHAGMIYDEAGRAALGRIYRSYLDIGREFDLPMIVSPPTWRANPERLRAAGLADGIGGDGETRRGLDVNGDACRFLAEIRASYGAFAERIYIGGLMGCRGDAYDPCAGLSEREAAEFHRPQARALAAAGVDFLMAATLPAYSDACN